MYYFLSRRVLVPSVEADGSLVQDQSACSKNACIDEVDWSNIRGLCVQQWGGFGKSTWAMRWLENKRRALGITGGVICYQPNGAMCVTHAG